MNEYTMFRLKLQYKAEKAENAETDEMEKVKSESLAQCVSYAEALVNKPISKYNMNRFEPCVYEIVKVKFKAGDIYLSPATSQSIFDRATKIFS